MYYVYILKSLKDGKLYIGKTRDLKTRFLNHQKGNVHATRTRIPLVLLYYEAFANRTDAGRDELLYKSGHGREILQDKLKYTLEKHC